MVLEVTDTGMGISAEALPHVFDRFYRADQARTRLPNQEGGNGLGLALTKELVEAHGGTIKIESDVGKGTKVTVQIPRNCESHLRRAGNTEQREDTFIDGSE